MIIVILAGGSGKRLFPFSTESTPKPFLKFSEKGSLFQMTLSRFIDNKSVNKILICTSVEYKELLEGQLAPFKNKNKCLVVLEPEKKDTLAAVMYSLSFTEDNQPIFVIPSDHYIHPEKLFFSYLEFIAENMPRQKLVSIGVFPQSPEIGYGYLKKGKTEDGHFFSVEEFQEKPSFEKAKEYLFSKKYLWNMGVLGFYKQTFVAEIKKFQPSYLALLNLDEIKDFYKKIAPLSLDHGLLQKTKSLLVVEASISWSDVGSWDRVYQSMEKDQNENVLLGNVHSFKTRKSLVMGAKKPIYAIGLEDVWIIDTEKALVIGRKGLSEQIKKMELTQDLS